MTEQTSIDDSLAALSADKRSALEKLRRDIRAAFSPANLLPSTLVKKLVTSRIAEKSKHV